MRAVNIMNFVRAHEPRIKDFDKVLFETTVKEIDLVKKYGFENTFLLQYDAIISKEYNYTELFNREKDDKMELGLWLEIVQPLCEKVGLPWRSENGWSWDWHIVPGFSMAYTPNERQMLIDEAMRAFKESFGFYPRTVGSWLIDTHTANYLSQHYEIDALCICRDQVNTDAYTLVGGYFNTPYFSSKNNIFTPAQSKEMQNNIPIIRLLTSDPIHTYDTVRFLPDDYEVEQFGCYTLEPVWKSGRDKDVVNWYYKTHFQNENLGFSYAHIGQENSFGHEEIMVHLTQQLDLLKEQKNVSIMKMCDMGVCFKEKYKETPATVVYADNDWCVGDDIQSLCYDSKRYSANLFRFKDRIFIRFLYLFDENVKEHYLDVACETWDAVYENLPIIDTIVWDKDNKDTCGMTLDTEALKFEVEKISESVVQASWKNKKVVFGEDCIEIFGCDASVNVGAPKADIKVCGNNVNYCYNGAEYSVNVTCGSVEKSDVGYNVLSDGGKIVIKL